MDGVLVIDKPRGLTSHDVVARARRALGQSRIGHTGTLDPLATGVLPLACGKAARLVRFLVASDKEYEAAIRFGITTDTYDIGGTETSRSDRLPTLEAVKRGLDELQGEYFQRPPAYSAKHVAGRRAYELARSEKAVTLPPVPVRVATIDLLEFTGAVVHVRLTCSSGFYVRTFAHSLGQLVAAGACLEALRRTRSGDFRLADSVDMDLLDREPAVAAARLVGLSQLLPGLPSVHVTADGRTRVSQGRELEADDVLGGIPERLEPWTRLVAPDGDLIGLGRPAKRSGFLHPSLVLI
jgi:tRNA pseudouridine55 synthase